MSIISKIALLFGWSPIGKAIEIRIEESVLTDLINKRLLARIISLNDDGSAVLELTDEIKYENEKFLLLMAHPRHKGYDFYHISLGTIAAELSINSANTVEIRIAIGFIRSAKT